MSEGPEQSGGWFWRALIVALLLLIPAAFWVWSSRIADTPEIGLPDLPANDADNSPEQKPFEEFADTDAQKETEEEVFEVFETLDEPEPQPKKGPPTSSEMPFADPVPGNPLVVVLPGANASLGHISIEKYSNDGNPTGQPLKRGTQVQIPDPNNPGEKIYFKVP